MSNIVVRSIFQTTVVERSWKTKVTSAAVHVLVIGGAFLLTVPVVQTLRNPVANEHITYVAPYLPKPHPTIEPPHIRHTVKLTPAIPPVIQPPVLAKVIPSPVIAAVVPKPLPPVPHTPAPSPKIEAEAKPAPAPKPVVKTGAFEDLQTAKAAAPPKQVVVGGFGDPHGVQSSDTQKPQPVLMARVGSFDSPTGAGQAGGGGHLDNGGVKQSGFGNATSAPVSGNGKANVQTGGFGDSTAGTSHTSGGAVRSTGFGDTLAAAAPQRKALPSSTPAFTPVEILFKPRPSYSTEAREMRLEGQVSLEVVFQASGSVRVVRIIKGLGHGLDEAAQQAALQVRFKPATRAGAPVDTSATISITFELT